MTLSTYFTLSTLGVCFGLVYVIVGCIYRLYFHPLAKFPGPKLAAATQWYEFYYNVIRPGKFLWKMEELHERYGPIIRINPAELHIKDSEFYEEIYAGASKKRDKYDQWVKASITPGSSFSTLNHDVHRMRRAVLNPFFSKRSIVSMEPLVKEKIELLAHRFKRAYETKEVLRLDAGYMALTMDIISQYSFGEDYKYVTSPDFGLQWKEVIAGLIEVFPLIRQFPWLTAVLKAPPLAVLDVVHPDAAVMVRWQHMIEGKVDNIIDTNQKGKKAGTSIFQAIIDSDLPPDEKTKQRLVSEGMDIIAAGSETTAKSLSFINYYLNQDVTKLEKLRKELMTVMPTPDSDVSLTQLEQLPYLTGVVNEGIRLMYGLTVRLPRVSNHEPMIYKDWMIPPGTPVSQSSYFVHRDPKIFPNFEEFDPERWIRAAEQGIYLDKYLVSFSKGSRSCVGIYLAYAEIYLTTAIIVRRFNMENYDTTFERDIMMDRDLLVGVPKRESKGIRAIISGLVKE